MFDRVHVYGIFQVLDIGKNEVLLMGGCSLYGLRIWHAFYICIVRSQQIVRPLLDPFCDIRVRWTAVRWVVFEAAVLRRIM